MEDTKDLINVVDPDTGEVGALSHNELPNALQQGYRVATPTEVDQHFKEEKYGTAGQMIKTGLEGAAESATFGLSNLAEKALGVKEEDIRNRREVNPGSHIAGQVGGLVGSSLLVPGGGAMGLAEKAGAGAAEAVGLGAAEGIAQKAGAAAIKAGVENAVIQSGNEISKMIIHDPEQTASSALMNVGVLGLLGGGAIGGAIGAISPLWEATAGKATNKWLESIAKNVEEAPEAVAAKGKLVINTNALKANEPLFTRMAPEPVETAVGSTVKGAVQDAAYDLKKDLINKGLNFATGGKFGILKDVWDGVGDTAKYALAKSSSYFQQASEPEQLAMLKFMGLSDKNISGKAFQSMVDLVHNAIQGQNRMTAATNAIFTAGREVLPEHLYPTLKEREKLEKRVQSLQTDQEPLLSLGGDTGHYMPEVGSALAQSGMNAVNYLNSLKPSMEKKSPLDSEPVVNGAQKADYNRAMDIAIQPLLMLDSIKAGNITSKDITHFNNLFPGGKQQMAQKLMNGVINSAHKKQSIPYKTRMGLSLFLGQPLDSTMTPMGIQSAQPKPQQSQPQQTAPSGKGTSMKYIGKVAQSYATPQQAREAHRLKS